MIKLFTFGSAFGVEDPSPFVLKLHTFLRIANLPYTPVASASNLNRAPKHKLPYIEDDGNIVCDTYFITEYLTDKYKLTLDDHLTEKQRCAAHLFTRSLDENLYWCIVYSRWMREDTWPVINKQFFGRMPLPLRIIIPGMVRRNLKQRLEKQGFGQHTDAEIMQIFEHSLRSLSGYLGDNRYFFGDKVSTFDATAYAFLASVISTTLNNPFNELAKTYQNLVDYCERIHAQYYLTATTNNATSAA